MKKLLILLCIGLTVGTVVKISIGANPPMPNDPSDKPPIIKKKPIGG